jgi:hypothetical protein
MDAGQEEEIGEILPELPMTVPIFWQLRHEYIVSAKEQTSKQRLSN